MTAARVDEKITDSSNQIIVVLALRSLNGD